MTCIVPFVRPFLLIALIALGSSLGGALGAAASIALAYLLIAPIAVSVAAFFYPPDFDPMGIGFSVMENCATLGLVAGVLASGLLIARRCRVARGGLQ
jgi:hypothetical protein